MLAALAEIIDPDRKASIVSLEMVSGLVVRDGHVGFTIEVDPSRGEALEPLRRSAEETVRKLPGVLSVTAVLTAEEVGGAAPAAGHDHGQASRP